MKLYGVNLTLNHCVEDYGLVVANSEEEAIKMLIEEHDVNFTYFESAHEVTEIYGYKVVFAKGKKITLVK